MSGVVAQGQVANPNLAVQTFVAQNQALFGHGPEALTRARVRRDYVTRHNGLRTVVWEQRLDDIAVFDATFQAHLTARGELVNVASRFVADPETAVRRSAPARAALASAPPVSAREAVAIAARNLGDALTSAQVEPQDTARDAERRQTFRAAPLNGAEAHLVWLPMDSTTLRLAWEVVCTSRTRGEMFRILVDAESGEPVVRHSLTERISNATYRVFTSDSPSPFSPGHPTPSTVQPGVVSRTLVTTPALNTTASPNGWINDGVMETRGNNVDAHIDANADDVPDLPRPQAVGTARVFDPPLDLTQQPSSYRDAAVVNLFYWCNFMHDKLYELGFTESAGNFQNDNFGRGGLGNDAVQADAQDGSGTDNANFSTPPDGSSGRMQMYVFTGTSPMRDGDFDAEIILHEYTHGLSNRLVGAGAGISAAASRSMGEGWSDFYGLALLSEPSDDVNGNYAAGAYASHQLGGLTQNYYFGIRRYPYTTDLTKNPLTFRDIDPTQASSHPGIPRSPVIGSQASEVHNAGEVWCVTLWEVRANLNQLALQLVTDGMKLSPANPNYLQARDAILQAELVATGGANRMEVWRGFAKRGMGAGATAPASSTTVGLVENFDLPDDLAVGPTSPLGLGGTVGGPFKPATTDYLLANNGTAPLTWTATKTVPWLDLSATGGTLAPGASVTVTVSPNATAGSLNVGLYPGTLTFTNTTSGVAQPRVVQLDVQPFTVPIFTETFESGTLDATRWTSTGTGTFRNQVTTASLPHGGIYHLTMDSSVDGSYSRNEATLTVNLAGERNLVLKFWAKMFSDEPDGPPASPFVDGADFDGVAISADGTNWYEVQSLRSPAITDGCTQFTVDLDAALAAHGLSYSSTFKIRFNHYDNFAIPVDGFAIDDIVVARISTNRLAFLLPAALAENAAPATITISATPAPATALTVALTSSLPAGLRVPATVTIPAGQSSATFQLTPVDDTLLNGTRDVTITAAAATWASASGVVALRDNESATLAVSLPATTTEGTTDATGTVTVSAAPATDVVVQLVSDDTTVLQPPATIVISAGRTSATFNIVVVDDNRINGPRTAHVTASVANWTSGSGTITVLDNESTALALSTPGNVREGDPVATGTVRIGGTLTADLVVALSSDDTTELTVPATVTILAGQTSATFPITIV
ncbi:MAG: M36 family metallopeptidase, partial [Verrucomicrobia bacterium]|nr:M36 family metallopeptidase [Verrucomicrobiota bacterium]